MSAPKWGGHRARQWTAAVLARYGRDCWLKLPGCTSVATTGDHVIPRAERLDLQYDVSNGRPACLPCNRRRRDQPVAHLVVDARDFFEKAASSASESAASPPRAAGKTAGLVRFESDRAGS